MRDMQAQSPRRLAGWHRMRALFQRTLNSGLASTKPRCCSVTIRPPSHLRNGRNFVTPFSLKNTPKLSCELCGWGRIVDWAGRCVVDWADRCKKTKKDKKSGGRAVGTTTLNLDMFGLNAGQMCLYFCKLVLNRILKLHTVAT